MVEVLNGTRRQGVARTATRMLRGTGLDVVFLGNADSAEASTRVIVRRGDPDRARYVVGGARGGKDRGRDRYVSASGRERDSGGGLPAELGYSSVDEQH